MHSKNFFHIISQRPYTDVSMALKTDVFVDDFYFLDWNIFP